MPRPSSTKSLSIAQLEQLLQGRRAERQSLDRERAKVARELVEIDVRLRVLDGARGRSGRNGRSRVRNEKSLTAMLESVLRSAGKPMGVGDIEAAVLKGGYKTKSGNFRGIVNQTLIKDKRFGSTARGIYQLKK